MRTPLAIAAISCCLLTAAVMPSGAGTASLGLHLHACTQGQKKAPASCGTFGVYENRQTRSGRTIPLGVVVLRAKHPGRDAIAFIEGGPGVGAVPDAAPVADLGDPVLATFQDRYDVLFVDNRGMGTSNPTGCNIAPYTDMPAYFQQIWPSKILAGCYRRYASTSDPSQYNTNNAVDDLDDIRAALGYRKLVLYGGSYASFFSFVYLRRHPEHVKSALLEGITAPHFQPLPGAPDGAQTALDDLVRKCARDPQCARAFPHFGDRLYAVLQRFDRGPQRVTVRNAKTKRFVPVLLSKEVLVDRLRENLYSPETASYLPYAIERAYHFDYVPIGRMIDLWSQFLTRAQDPGTNLAYRCADMDPFISESELQTAAQRSFTSDLRVRAERAACAIWKVDPMPPSFNDPVVSSVPVLLLNGSDDPVTPPKYAQGAVRYLSNGKLVLVRGAGHGVDTPCTTRVMIQFLRDGSAKHINATQCRGAFKTPPFATSMAGWDKFE